MIKITKWGVCALLERHLINLLDIRKRLKKLKASTEEIDHSISEIQALIENLSIDE